MTTNGNVLKLEVEGPRQQMSAETTMAQLKFDAATGMLNVAQEIGEKLEAVLLAGGVRNFDHCRVGGYFLCTIAESFVGALAVMRSTAQSHAFGLLRTMLEAYIDLKILSEDSKHVACVELADAIQLSKVCDGYEGIPDMEKDQQQQVSEWLAVAQKTRATLEAQGVKSLRIREKFKRAGRDDLYGTAYAFFCQSSHNNLVILRSRHAGLPDLRLGYPLPLTSLQSTLTLAISIYGQAIQLLPKISAVDLKVVSDACDELEKSWAAVLKKYEGTLAAAAVSEQT